MDDEGSHSTPRWPQFLHAYVNNNAVSYVDPKGLYFPEDAYSLQNGPPQGGYGLVSTLGAQASCHYLFFGGSLGGGTQIGGGQRCYFTQACLRIGLGAYVGGERLWAGLVTGRLRRKAIQQTSALERISLSQGPHHWTSAGKYKLGGMVACRQAAVGLEPGLAVASVEGSISVCKKPKVAKQTRVTDISCCAKALAQTDPRGPSCDSRIRSGK